MATKEQMRIVLTELVLYVSNYLDIDEPQEEWIDAVWSSLDKAKQILKETNHD